MKLLVMGNNGHLGGLSVHYLTLIDYLSKEKDIELTCIHINDKNEKVFNNNRIKEIVIPYQPKSIFEKVNKMIKLQFAARFAKSVSPDVFIATGLGYGYAFVASKLGNNTFKAFEEVHFEATADKLRLKMLEHFDAVATQTQGMITPFKQNVSEKRPVSHLPCFSKEYQANGFKEIPATDKGIKLAYFGRLAWNKGLKEFVDFTAEAFKEQENLTLDIFGGGPEKDSIQAEISKHQLDNKITLKGFYSDEEFPDLISSYHGIILPSIATEGLPLILIEAMRFGRPVFTTTTGAMPEVGAINTEGMIVVEKDRDSFSSGFKRFIKSINKGGMDAAYINGIYTNHFSNAAFKEVWLKMLKDPKSYFNN